MTSISLDQTTSFDDIQDQVLSISENIKNLDTDNKTRLLRIFVERMYGEHATLNNLSTHAQECAGLQEVCHVFHERSQGHHNAAADPYKKTTSRLSSLWVSALIGLSTPGRYSATKESSDVSSLSSSDSSNDEDSDTNNESKSMNPIENLNDDALKTVTLDLTSHPAQFIVDQAMTGLLSMEKEITSKNLLALVTNFLVKSTSVEAVESCKKIANRHNRLNVFVPLRKIFVRGRLLFNSPSKYKKMLGVDRKKLGNALGMNRNALTEYIPLLSTRRSAQAEETHFIRELHLNATASIGHLLKTGSTIYFKDIQYNKNEMKIESVVIDTNGQVVSITAIPCVETIAGSYFPSTIGGINQGDGFTPITYTAGNDETKFQLPRHVGMTSFPKGHAGAGAELPLKEILIFMYQNELIKCVQSIEGDWNIVLCVVADGTQTGRSNRMRFLNTTLLAIVGCGDAVLIRSVLNAIVTMCWTATDNRPSHAAHGSGHIKQLQNVALPALVEYIKETEDKNVTAILVLGADGKYLTDCSAMKKVTATDLNRTFAWRHTMRYSAARSFDPEASTPVFQQPTNRDLEVDNILYEIGNEALAIYMGLELDKRIAPGVCIPYHLRCHEILHNGGRGGQPTLSKQWQQLLLCGQGMLDRMEEHTKDVVGINTRDGFSKTTGDMQLRVGLMRRLLLNRRLFDLDNVTDPFERKVLEINAQIALAYRLAHRPLMYYDTSTLETTIQNFFFFVNLFHALLAHAFGSMEWKPTSMHFMFMFHHFLVFCQKYNIDPQSMDMSVIEVFHNYTKENYKNGSDGSWDMIANQVNGCINVCTGTAKHVESNLDSRNKRHALSLAKKNKVQVVLVAEQAADLVLARRLANGYAIFSVESQSLSALKFKEVIEASDGFEGNMETLLMEVQEIRNELEEARIEAEAEALAAEEADALAEEEDAENGEDVEDVENDGDELGNQLGNELGNELGGELGGELEQEEELADDADETAAPIRNVALEASLASANRADAVDARREVGTKLVVSQIEFTTPAEKTVTFPISLDGLGITKRGTTDPQQPCLANAAARSEKLRLGITEGGSNSLFLQILSGIIDSWVIDIERCKLIILLSKPGQIYAKTTNSSYLTRDAADPTAGIVAQAIKIVVSFEETKLVQIQSWMNNLGNVDVRYAMKEKDTIESFNSALQERNGFDVAGDGASNTGDPTNAGVHSLPVTKHRVEELCQPSSRFRGCWKKLDDQLKGQAGCLLSCNFTAHPDDNMHGVYYRKGEDFGNGRPMRVELDPTTGLRANSEIGPVHFICPCNFRYKEKPPTGPALDAFLVKIGQRPYSDPVEEKENADQTPAAPAATVLDNIAVVAEEEAVVRQMVTRRTVQLAEAAQKEAAERAGAALALAEETKRVEEEQRLQEELAARRKCWKENNNDDNCTNVIRSNVVLGDVCTKHAKMALVEIFNIAKNRTTPTATLTAIINKTKKYLEDGIPKPGLIYHRKFYVMILHQLRFESFQGGV